MSSFQLVDLGTKTRFISYFVSVISAGDTCSELPPKPSDDVKYIGGSEPLNGDYQSGDKAVYKCKDSGFGYVSLSCLGNDIWGSQSRNCDG